ncbi:glycosyltransferase [Nocardioides sp. GY 10127]|uniref:glycosyltransferase family 2 protein n=1 Tax=Nocardioides sp. GY 10127 TaxID=2569762 RepID=UPI0010A8158F|nr:glycosyltransferase [Nocardioides sp. GY 10127]TIC86550.1 glycosyltransferase [Nocardioides sp. GY 10127]
MTPRTEPTGAATTAPTRTAHRGSPAPDTGTALVEDRGHLSSSVVVCAYTERRWEQVVAGLAGIAAQTRTPDAVVLVIDHNPAMLERARRELARGQDAGPYPVLVVANARPQGASGSRNTGTALVRSEVTVFLDDDAVPEPDWLERLLAPYCDPDVAAVGGHAEPVWPGAGAPAQLAPELWWVVGCTYRGMPTRLTPVRNLWGCNMSVRTEVFRRVGGFDESAGRVEAFPLGCEETELCIRVGALPGARVLLEPAARVHHHVSSDRVRWRYLRHRSLLEGVSKAAMAARVGDRDATSTEWGYVLRVLPRGVLRGVARGLTGRPDGWQAAAGIVVSLAMAATGYLRQRVGLARGLGLAPDAPHTPHAPSGVGR